MALLRDTENRITFEDYRHEMDQGIRPEGVVNDLSYTQVESKHVEEIREGITRMIGPHERMLAALPPDLVDFDPYSLTLFQASELINDNKKEGPYRKLRIAKKLLLPELEDRFSHVVTDTLEFDMWMLEKLSQEKRNRILISVALFEISYDLAVRFEGVIGLKK